MLNFRSPLSGLHEANSGRETNTVVNTFETSPENSLVAKLCNGPDPS